MYVIVLFQCHAVDQFINATIHKTGSSSSSSSASMPASIVKVTPPGLNTCDGAYTKYFDLISKCPGPFSPASCGSDACKAVITSIDDSIKTGFTATGCVYGAFLPYVSYGSLKTRATECGHAASIVKVTPPALNTCEGAHGRYGEFITQECPMSGTDPSAYRATCGNDACKAAISSIDDNTVSLMTTGFTTCTPSKESPFSYQFLIMTATNCGHPASTVKVTPPAGASLAWLLLYKFL
jgi:hypothetical protein